MDTHCDISTRTAIDDFAEKAAVAQRGLVVQRQRLSATMAASAEAAHASDTLDAELHAAQQRLDSLAAEVAVAEASITSATATLEAAEAAATAAAEPRRKAEEAAAGARAAAATARERVLSAALVAMPSFAATLRGPDPVAVHQRIQDRRATLATLQATLAGAAPTTAVDEAVTLTAALQRHRADRAAATAAHEATYRDQCTERDALRQQVQQLAARVEAADVAFHAAQRLSSSAKFAGNVCARCGQPTVVGA